jgi:hypothetical protein
MRGSGIALCLTFASICAAQSGSAPVTPATALAMTTGSCPIRIEARQQPRDPYLLADTTRVVHPSYQITFRPLGPHAIQEVVLALSGPSGLHLRNAATSGKGNEIEKFTLTGSGDAMIATKKLTAVEWLSLVSVTYVDGSQWQRSDTNVCRVAPVGFVLVQ